MHRSASCCLQNLEQDWSAIIFVLVKRTERRPGRWEQSEAMTWSSMSHNSHIWLGWCKSGFPRRGFPQELHPWVKEEASRTDAQDTEWLGCPKKGGIKWLPKPGNERQKWQKENRLLCCDPEQSTGLLQGTPKYIKRIFFLWRMRIKVSKVSSLFYVRKSQSN